MYFKKKNPLTNATIFAIFCIYDQRHSQKDKSQLQQIKRIYALLNHKVPRFNSLNPCIQRTCNQYFSVSSFRKGRILHDPRQNASFRFAFTLNETYISPSEPNSLITKFILALSAEFYPKRHWRDGKETAMQMHLAHLREWITRMAGFHLEDSRDEPYQEPFIVKYEWIREAG